MKFRSLNLRTRLLIWQSGLLALLLAGFGLTTLQLQQDRRIKSIDDALLLRIGILVDALRSAQRPPGMQSPPDLHLSPENAALFNAASGFYFAIWMRSPTPTKTSEHAPSDLPKPNAEDPVYRFRGSFRETHLAAAPVDVILVGHSMENEFVEFKHLATGLFSIGVLILAAGILGGWVVTTKAISPLAEISATAVQIANGDLSRRIPEPPINDELAELIRVLNTTFARLQAAFERQTRFTADAAHELRTPLAVLLTRAQSALIRERNPIEYQEALVAIERTAQRMRQLVELLLHLARLDAGTEALSQTPLNLSSIASECIQLIEPLAQSRGITLHRDLQDSNCCGDGIRLSQVISNLLNNAVDYNKPGGRISITTRQTPHTAILSVEDTGQGIAPDDLIHIFERFQRGDKARSSQSEIHCGLGLAIAHAIVRAHGGHIEVKSTQGEGSTFVVTLPV